MNQHFFWSGVKVVIAASCLLFSKKKVKASMLKVVAGSCVVFSKKKKDIGLD